MPALIQLLPGVTISGGGGGGGGGGSLFALAGSATPSETSVAIAQSTFTVYGVALDSGSSAPTAAAIEAGTGAIDTDSANAIASLSFTGLSASTTYDFYIVGKDGALVYGSSGTVQVTGLTASANYEAFAFLQDLAGNQSSVTSLAVLTTGGSS